MREMIILLIMVAAAELPHYQAAVVAYAVLGLISAALLMPHLHEAAVVLLGQGILLPLVLWRYAAHTEPWRPWYLTLGAVLLGAAAIYLDTGLLPWLSLLPLAVGTWTILTNRGRFRQVLGLCLVESGVDWALPNLPLLAEVGILAALALAVWLLLETGEKEVGV